MRITPHARVRAMERISPDDLRLFVRGVEEAIRKGRFFGPWAVRVWAGRSRCLGVAVGVGEEWTTTLRPGQTPQEGSEVRTVRV